MATDNAVASDQVIENASEVSGLDSDHGRIKLPGFGIDYQKLQEQTARFSALEEWNHPFPTLRERWMLTFINQVTDKPNWERKVFDEGIVARWKKEATEKRWNQDWGMMGGRYVYGEDDDDEEEEHNEPCDDFTETMFQQSIEELRDKAALYEEHSIIPVLDAGSCVLKSDKAIPVELKEALKQAVARLENVPEKERDWHPGSDGKVLDLVHPSLFPLVYRRSRVLPTSTINLDNCLRFAGCGEIIPDPDEQSSEADIWSPNFQWLPCNVAFPDREHAEIISYINNLHPYDHKDLYLVLEKIIDHAVPFWNIIAQSHPVWGPLMQIGRFEDSIIDYVNEEEYDGNSDEGEEEKPKKVYNRGSPITYEPRVRSEHIKKRFAFLGDGEKKIQLIIKLANIVLTPDKPEYEGGNWHVEGQLNEHIISTGIYYYDNHNITESHLAFSTKVDHEDLTMENYRHENVDYDGLEQVFGLGYDDQYKIELGSIKTREDRFIAFPNGFQHQVGSFKLQDPTKPGHRKILAMFLVAPQDPILSTANIPPQRRDWWMRELAAPGTRLGDLPKELLDMVGEQVEGFPISLEEAREIRVKLMAERSRMDENAQSWMEASISAILAKRNGESQPQRRARVKAEAIGHPLLKQFKEYLEAGKLELGKHTTLGKLASSPTWLLQMAHMTFIKPPKKNKVVVLRRSREDKKKVFVDFLATKKAITQEARKVAKNAMKKKSRSIDCAQKREYTIKREPLGLETEALEGSTGLEPRGFKIKREPQKPAGKASENYIRLSPTLEKEPKFPKMGVNLKPGVNKPVRDELDRHQNGRSFRLRSIRGRTSTINQELRGSVSEASGNYINYRPIAEEDWQSQEVVKRGPQIDVFSHKAKQTFGRLSKFRQKQGALQGKHIECAPKIDKTDQMFQKSESSQRKEDVLLDEAVCLSIEEYENRILEGRECVEKWSLEEKKELEVYQRERLRSELLSRKGSKCGGLTRNQATNGVTSKVEMGKATNAKGITEDGDMADDVYEQYGIMGALMRELTSAAEAEMRECVAVKSATKEVNIVDSDVDVQYSIVEELANMLAD
ncbi:hypothetical protein N0V90_003062 [Kalmusia sp. IMI 367209]|nr:hypothetical protein N0V90_003062 [Kalmusia sp. IMI 367209]